MRSVRLNTQFHGITATDSAARDILVTRVLRCTVHKTVNILNKVAKSGQPQIKPMLHDIWDAPTEKAAEKPFDLFEKTLEVKSKAAIQDLRKDRDKLLTFYSFLPRTGATSTPQMRSRAHSPRYAGDIGRKHRKTRASAAAGYTGAVRSPTSFESACCPGDVE